MVSSSPMATGRTSVSAVAREEEPRVALGGVRPDPGRQLLPPPQEATPQDLARRLARDLDLAEHERRGRQPDVPPNHAAPHVGPGDDDLGAGVADEPHEHGVGQRGEVEREPSVGVGGDAAVGAPHLGRRPRKRRLRRRVADRRLEPNRLGVRGGAEGEDDESETGEAHRRQGEEDGLNGR